MANVRIQMTQAQGRWLLTNEGVRAAVAAEAEKVAARARGNTDDEIVTNHAGRSRARSYVTRLGSGARGEAADRALGRSIGGA